MKKNHLKSSFAIRAVLVAAAVAVHSTFADTPDELLEYVESTGTQYIDTGIVGKSGTKASMQMMWTKNESDKSFLAARKSSSERFFLLHRYNATHIFAGYWGKTSQIIEISENNVYSVITEVKTDGTYTVSANGTSKTLDTSGVGAKNTGYSLYLFAMNNAGSPAYYSSARCYGTKIWQIPDGGTGYALVRDFVPCKKGDRVGLWDRVSGDIFYPATGTLTAGSTVAIHAEPDKMLEYVESDGTQYIDTGVVGRDGTKAEMTLVYTSLTGGNVGHVMLGSSSGASTNMFYMPWCRTYNSYYRAMTGYNSRYQYIYWAEGYSAIYTDTKYTLSCEVTANCHYNATLNGYDNSYDYSANGPVDTGYPMYAFAANDSGVAAKYASAKLYSLKIWQTDANGDYSLVCDFRPCIKDGKAGLFDKVSNMVYFSRGTKDFSAEGARMLSARGTYDKLLEYVESDGTQYIDTGVIGRDGTKSTMTVAWTVTPPVNGGTACDWCFLGSYGNGQMFYLFRWLNNNYNTAGIYTGYNGRWGKHGYSPPTDSSYEVVSEVTMDGTYKMSHSGHDQTWNYTANAPVNTGCNLYLFARDNAGTADNFMPVRCYGVKIWQTDANGDYQLVRDFIPCIKDGSAGFYDSVSDTVYFSLGANEFSAEGARVLSARGAPDKFLKYVASTGEQYIDTGVVGRDGTKAEIDFKFNELGSSSIILLGADKSDPWTDNIKFYLLAYRSVNGTITDGYEKRYNQTFDATTDRSQVISEAMVGGTFKTTMNGRTVTHDYTTNPGPYNSGLSLYLFTNNRNGTAGTLSAKARCYGLKIWQADANGVYQTVRNYKPCLKDGRAGLYDEVSDTVYFSLSKTDLVAPPKGVMVIVE